MPCHWLYDVKYSCDGAFFLILQSLHKSLHKFPLQHVRIQGIFQGSVACDSAFFVQLQKALIHGTHLLLTGGGDHTFDLMYLIVADHVPDGRGETHDLKYGDASAFNIRDQLLGDDCLKNHGKLNGDLALLGRLKYIQDTLDGVGSSQCVRLERTR